MGNRSGKSYGHRIRDLGHGDYMLYWTTDRYYAGSRLRHPRISQRVADRKGAERFAKRWGVKMPEPKGGA